MHYCIREFAAIQVYCGHFSGYFAKQHDQNAIHGYGYSSNQVDFGGGNAVLIFFFMGGFLMQIGYSSKVPKLSSNNIFNSMLFELIVYWFDFTKQRVARIAPMVWVAVLIYIPFTIPLWTITAQFCNIIIIYNNLYSY